MILITKKHIKKLLKSILLFSTISSIGHADIVPPDDSNNTTTSGGDETSVYLKNLGQYFGFDVGQACDSNACLPKPGSSNAFFSTLLDLTKINGMQNEVLITSIRALLPNVTATSENSFANSNSEINFVNAYANAAFPGNNGSVPGDLDQKNSKITDPGDISNLDMLTTNTTCIPTGNKAGNPCQSLTADEFLAKMVGPLKADGYPVTGSVLSTDANLDLAKKLNFNRLYNFPMLNEDGKNKAGFNLKEAMNLIHYITVPYIPLSIDAEDYTNTYRQALDDTNKTKQLEAKNTIYRFLTQIRTIVAQKSVLINNFNQVVANRMPVLKDHNGENTSQAMSLLNMASWRLANPTTGLSWRDMINKASNSTVQKENAILLSEINYQLYLMNQNLERLLLTNSVMAIQNTSTVSSNVIFNKENTTDQEQNDPDAPSDDIDSGDAQ